MNCNWAHTRVFDATSRRYVTAYDVAAQIRASQRACRTGGYLECVTQHARVTKLTAEYARAVGIHPDEFLDALRACEES